MSSRIASVHQHAHTHTRAARLLAGAFGLTIAAPALVTPALAAPSPAAATHHFAPARDAAARAAAARAAATVPGATYAAVNVSDDGLSRPDFYRYQEMAFPKTGISPALTKGARDAFNAVAANATTTAWTSLSYEAGIVPGPVTYTGHPFTASGRVTALAATPGCTTGGSGPCLAFAGAAGGGIWVTANPFTHPVWTSSSTGLGSNAIGAIAIDPNAAGQTIYVGTGEPNSSVDSEAGVGVFKSTDGGKTWAVIPATVPLASGLSVSSVIVDARDSTHLLFSTQTALHGAGASDGGENVTPGADLPGIWESHDGGKTFTALYTALVDNYSNGITQMATDPRDPDTIYAAAFDLGIIRSSQKLDGDRLFRQIYTHQNVTGGTDDNFNRQSFALAATPKTTRIYIGDSNDGDASSYLYRIDNADLPAYQLTNGTTNTTAILLSNPTPGTPGYGSWNFCEGQCWYDQWLASPPGQPDVIWFGGSFQYNDIFTANPPSNGRGVMRSTNAGVSFTDMTRDAQNSPNGMHPDQHALLFNPNHPAQVIAASDGGLALTSGKFTDASAQCATRGLSGADLTDCQGWLAAIPTRMAPANAGLVSLQFQDVEYNPQAPDTMWQGGTQDNGTWGGTAGAASIVEVVGGDGGLSGFDAVKPSTRYHTYYGTTMDVNFKSGAVLAWDYMSQPLASSGEASQFYMATIPDPLVSGTIFAGLQHVWRTQDDGGPQATLDTDCNEYTGTFPQNVVCGDWVPLGSDLTSATFGSDRTGSDVVLISRAKTDPSTLWAATLPGRLFISSNANASDPSTVSFTRIDSATTPDRVITGVAIDATDSTHAYVSYTGYNAYTPKTPGHVFDVHANPGGTPTFTNISYNLGDLPVTALTRDDSTGRLFAATDFGVLTLAKGSREWVAAGTGLPAVSVFQVKITPDGLLYAATHGRSIWTLKTR